MKVCHSLLLLLGSPIKYTSSFLVPIHQWAKGSCRAPRWKRVTFVQSDTSGSCDDGNKVTRDQDSTPLIDALAHAATKVRSPLFYPGHKMGSGAPERLVDAILGGHLDILRHDLPELPELDNLFAPEGPIRDAENLAADAFGAAKTWFLANGSTCGVIASILACVRRHTFRQRPGLNSPPNSVVILPRDTHKSAIHALVLSGATPYFLSPQRHRPSGLSLGISISELEGALDQLGDKVAAAFIVSPTYEGACLDVARAARTCFRAKVPLIVDEAHGAHLSFLDSTMSNAGGLPEGALRSGASLVVQSAHKSLGSLTQSALLHLGEKARTTGDQIRPLEEAVTEALATVQSSSPSYLLLASLDAARWSLAGTEQRGKLALNEAVSIVRHVKEEVSKEAGLQVVNLSDDSAEDVARDACMVRADPLRLTISFDGDLGGFEADEILMEEFGVYAELPAADSITFAFGPGSTREHGRMLVEALRHVAREACLRKEKSTAQANLDATQNLQETFSALDLTSQLICTPREAFFGRSEIMRARDAVGLASAETVSAYPPGIPTFLPGEIITDESLDFLESVKAAGGVISGCSDPSLETVRVVILEGKYDASLGNE